MARAARAAERVNRTLAEGDHVTQFELLTAAALWEMAERGVEVAVIEAGLGGRYDATNVIDSGVTVLTNVGLEHTRWLGPTLTDIAEEKLAVVRARRHAGARRRPGPDGAAPWPSASPPSAARGIVPAPTRGAGAGACSRAGRFQRRNFALARAAARGLPGAARGSHARRAARSRAAGARRRCPGRLPAARRRPADRARRRPQPGGVAALVRVAAGVSARAAAGAVLGVLDDKDAARDARDAAAAVRARVVHGAAEQPRALPPATLESLARQLGFDAAAACEPDPRARARGTRAWAREPGGVVLATGSVYLIGDLLVERSALGARASALRAQRLRG